MKNLNIERTLRWSIFVSSIALISIGVMREETRTVLKKAINICLECIGIG